MWWRRGVIVDSLNFRVEREIRSTLGVNVAFKSRGWNWIEKNALSYSNKPFLAVSKLILGLIGLALAIFLWKELLIEALSPYRPELLAFDLYLSEILTSQLTLIGLVYPIVVGLIAFFLQRQTGSRPMWVIFERYSAFRFVGLNGLFLSLTIVLSYFLRPFIDHQLVDIFTITILLWFAFNLVSALWFLYSIFNLVDSATRSEIVTRYIVNEVMPVMIRKGRKDSHIQDFIEMLSNAKKISSKFKLSNLSYNEENLTFELVVKKSIPSMLDNIFFLPFAVITFLWTLFSNEKKQELLVPIKVIHQSKEFEIFKSDQNIPFVIGLFFRLCFRFKKVNHDSDSFNFFLSADIAPLVDAFEGGKDHEIETEMNEYLNRFKYLVDAMEFKHNGDHENWLLLESGFGHAPISSTLEEFYHLSQFGIDQLSNSIRPFYRALQLPVGMYSRTNTAAPLLNKKLMMASYWHWELLTRWRSTVSADESAKALVNFRSLMSDFVGVWEQWLTLIRIGERRKNTRSELVELRTYHLELTCKLVVYSLKYNQTEMAKWSIDVVNNWFNKAYGSRHQLISYDAHEFLVVFPADASKPNEFLSYVKGIEEPISDRVYEYQAILNYWKDIRLITALYIWPESREGDADSRKGLALALLNQDRLILGGDDRSIFDHKIRSANEIVEAFLRQQWYWGSRDSGYPKNIKKYIESIGRMSEERLISGRFYTLSGFYDPRSMGVKYLALLVELSTNKWSLSRKWIEFISSEHLELHHRGNITRDLNQWVSLLANNIDEAKTEDHPYYQRWLNCKESIESLIEIIDDVNKERITSAPQDEIKLLRLAQAASKKGFVPSPNNYILMLFNAVKVDFVPVSGARSVTISGFQRSRVSKGLEDYVVHGEDEMLQDAVQNSIQRNIARDIYAELNSKSELIIAESSESLSNSIASDAQRMSTSTDDTVILAGSWDFYVFLEDGSFNRQKAKELAIEKIDGYPENYICHLNGIPVYQIPEHASGFVYLLDKKILREIVFSKIESGSYVKASFNSEPDSIVGDLKLTYWMETKFSEGVCQAYRLRSVSEQNNENG